MGLSVLGIALGVSLVMAIDLANQSAKTAFNISIESIAGKATHQIVGGSGGIPDSVYARLRLESGFRDSAPIVEGFAKSLGDPAITFRLLGVDVFAERPFRPFLSGIGADNGGFGRLMADSNAVIIATEAATLLGLNVGDSLKIRSGTHLHSVKIVNLLAATDDRQRQALQSLMIADIATAQNLLKMTGSISRIDLILPLDASEREEIIASLSADFPPGLQIQASTTRSDATTQMIRAFDINLTALSLLALIVGMFLIYNTMTFSVVQRRQQIAVLKCIGVTRREIFAVVIAEAVLLGISGTFIGLLLGIFLGNGLVHLISRTINDLYFVVSVQQLSIEPLSLIKGISLGIGATVLATIQPAGEATRTLPRLAMSRSGQESALRRQIPLRALAGAVVLLAGAIILWLPGTSILISYLGMLPVIVGFTLLIPASILLLTWLMTPLWGKLFGLIGRMASRDISAHMSRTSVAIAALTIAVAATVGVGSMINSFRGTVVHWLESRLEADIYVSPPSLLSRRNDAVLDSVFASRLMQLPEVSSVNYFRENFYYRDDGPLHLVASSVSASSREGFAFKTGELPELWQEFDDQEGLLVTEPYAFRHSVVVGDSLLLPTDLGQKWFKIAGIYYDYGSDVGIVTMSFDTYRKYWRDRRISGMAMFLKDGESIDRTIGKIHDLAGSSQMVLARSNAFLRQTSIEVFDRTFLITRVLHLLSIGVAFIGVLSALMALQMERARELAILRANGLTPTQLWQLIMLQTGAMGLFSGLLALPLGNALAVILIYVINQRSFGWTLQYQFLPDIHLQAILIAVVAALLAGIYPAWKMSKTTPAGALREE